MDENKTGLTSLKEIIDSLMRGSDLAVNPEDARIWRIWDDAVGPVVARNAHPLWIRKGLLRVKVSEPIWLQELGLSEQAIRERLNERLGRTAVRRIEFRLNSK
jgi:predicted nucleic acid-binding Zn ribbon protein